MNTLAIRFRDYEYEIDGVLQLKPHRQSEFVIDGRGLGDAFFFESDRPWFGQTPFGYLPDHAGILIEQLRGVAPVDGILEHAKLCLAQ